MCEKVRLGEKEEENMKKAKEKNRMREMREWEEKNDNEGMTTKRENKLLEESPSDDLQIETENH